VSELIYLDTWDSALTISLSRHKGGDFRRHGLPFLIYTVCHTSTHSSVDRDVLVHTSTGRMPPLLPGTKRVTRVKTGCITCRWVVHTGNGTFV
jgi:hypothetical protein